MTREKVRGGGETLHAHICIHVYVIGNNLLVRSLAFV